jgi:glycosyltransferase involved in cell wall biosynthesis
MRFTFVSTMDGVAWGGSEELWSRTALSLCKAGHQIRISVFDWPTRPRQLAELAAAGANVNFRPRKRGLLGRAWQGCLTRVFPGPLSVAERSWLRRDATSLVVVSQGGPFDGVPWMLACARAGIPYCNVVQAHSEIWWPPDEDLDAIRQALDSARRVFFVSHANHRLMERQCAARLGNAEVVSNPLNAWPSEALAWPEETGMTHLACVARLEPRAKGQDLLLELFSSEKWRRRPLQLNLYGGGCCERSLRDLVSMFGAKQVQFQGHIEDVSSIWKKNHALILPSRYEGLPLAIAEAMLCGRPVITTDVAGNTELVRDGVNGFVAPAAALSLMDDALERAWVRRSEWKEIGLQARQDALKSVPADPIGEFSRKLLDLAG